MALRMAQPAASTFFFFFKINQASVISFIPSKVSQRSLFGKMLITSVSGSSPLPLPALVWLLGGLPALPLDTSQCEQMRQKRSPDFRGTVSQLQSSGQHAPGGPRLRCCHLQGNHTEDAPQWPCSLPVTSFFLLESLSFFYLSSKCNPRRVGWRRRAGKFISTLCRLWRPSRAGRPTLDTQETRQLLPRVCFRESYDSSSTSFKLMDSEFKDAEPNIIWQLFC